MDLQFGVSSGCVVRCRSMKKRGRERGEERVREKKREKVRERKQKLALNQLD